MTTLQLLALLAMLTGGLAAGLVAFIFAWRSGAHDARGFAGSLSTDARWSADVPPGRVGFDVTDELRVADVSASSSCELSAIHYRESRLSA